MIKFLRIVVIMLVSLTQGCVQETFMDEVSHQIISGSEGLKYPVTDDAREFSLIVSGPPSVNTFGLTPSFEIVSVKDASNNVLDQSYLDFVSIQGATAYTSVLSEANWVVTADGDTTKQVNGVDFSRMGVVTIEDGNNFSNGDYHFSIKVTTQNMEESYEEVFEDALEISIGPKLATGLVYIPTSQNLLTGGGETAVSTEPLAINANADIRYDLTNYQDTLTINETSGAISLDANYVTDGIDLFYPEINVTSNISEEVVTFSDVLTIWASNDGVVIPKDTIVVFYPTMQAVNTLFGFQLQVTEAGVLPAEPWRSLLINPEFQASYRPLENTSQRMVTVQGNIGLLTDRHTSWLIMNSQDLGSYQVGFNLEASFYMRNEFVEYMTDGRTPSEVGVFVSTDYADDVTTATWTRVDDDLQTIIENNSEFSEEESFAGLPYPGDQNGLDPDGQKSILKNADGRWTKCTLDLAPYKDTDHVTLAFQYISNFEDQINFTLGQGRGGIYDISDVYFIAFEQ